MEQTQSYLKTLTEECRDLFKQNQVILSFQAYIEALKQSPRLLIRNAAEYLRDTFDHFSTRTVTEGRTTSKRFCLFDLENGKNGPIIGGEQVQDDIYTIINSFVKQGYANKLILLHGPNGSSKTSTIEAICLGMHRYSETNEGSVYTFNWIFPTERTANPTHGDVGPIGFGSRGEELSFGESYAYLDEAKIASKIRSEFHDNPIFLIPPPQREIWLRKWIAVHENIKPEDVELPPHVLLEGLSKKNQLIYENLFSAYDGDLSKVLKHVQVERFYYSQHYRVGIATVLPQMTLDADEKQLTMDRSIANLPTVLHNIRFHEAQGPLVEANRGLLEFSDMLKRPIEAYKYLLSSIEKSIVNLPSSNMNLDVVFFGTTNEKHLDAFKTSPDFSSFRSRMELVTVPYLLRPSFELKIYNRDLNAIKKSKKIAPHCVDLLCTWAVMTRLKQPDPERYESKYRALISRLDPRNKVKLYDMQNLSEAFKPAEAAVLRELREKLMRESQGLVIYEGRYGASPREIRQILYRASQNPEYLTLTPMVIFEELSRLVKDRTVYEFLQFEARGKYHDATQFINDIKDDFADIFEYEILMSMSLVAEGEYESFLTRYVEHVVASIKKEKIYSPTTSSYEPPSENLMKDIEKIIGVSGSVERHRENLLSRIAAWKLDNPEKTLSVPVIFDELLRKIQDHYFEKRDSLVRKNYQVMLSLGTDKEKNFTDEEKSLAETTFAQLDNRFGYDRQSAVDCLKFLLKHRPK